MGHAISDSNHSRRPERRKKNDLFYRKFVEKKKAGTRFFSGQLIRLLWSSLSGAHFWPNTGEPFGDSKVTTMKIISQQTHRFQPTAAPRLRRFAGALTIIICGLFAGGWPGSLTAEVLQLRDGTLVDGRIVSQDQKRVVIKTDAGQRVIEKSQIRRIVYDPGMAAKLLGDEARKENEKREAERQKLLEEQRRREAEALAKKQAEEAARDEVLNRREALEARSRYAVLVDEYRRRVQAEQERLAREEALRKKQQPDEVADQEEGPRQIDRWGPLWRSALIPGWGQFYAGSPVSGSLFGGLFAFGTVNAYNEYTSFTDTAFLAPLLPGAGIPVATVVYFETGRRSETYARSVKRQQQSIYFLGGIYLTQLLHAAFLSKDLGPAVLLDPTIGDQGGVSLFADQVELQPSDQVLGAGRQGPDSRLGFGYSLRF